MFASIRLSRRFPTALLSLVLCFLLAACGAPASRKSAAGRPDGAVRTIHVPSPPPKGQPYVIAQPLAELTVPDVPRNFLVHRNALYVFIMLGGIAVVDIADPAQPRPTALLMAPGNPSVEAPGNLRHRYLDGIIDAENERLLIVDRHHGLSVFLLQDPLSPLYSHQITLPSNRPIELTLIGQNLLVAAGPDGLLHGVPADDGYEFESILAHYDHVKEAEFYPPHWLLLADGYDGGLQVLDYRHPQSPRPLAIFQTGSFCDGLAAGDGVVMINNRGAGFLAIDLHDPARPFIASRSQVTAGMVRTVIHWRDNRFLVGNLLGFFDIIDLTDPHAPRWLARVPTGAPINTLLTHGDLVFVGMDRNPALDDARPVPNLKIFRLLDRTTPPNPPAMNPKPANSTP